MQIAPKNILFTGDLTAYCADPKATVNLIRQSGIKSVMGNCEEQLAENSSDCNCGYAKDSSCDLLAARWYRYNTQQLDEQSKNWMGSLPHFLRFKFGGKNFTVLHGGMDKINQFIFPATPEKEKIRQLTLAKSDAIIGGHCGIPFSQVINKQLWHNAGVIGLPANDGTPRVWYSIFREQANAILIEHHPLCYDHTAAATAIKTANLPSQYAQTLLDGIWPSNDVMPEADRKQTAIQRKTSKNFVGKIIPRQKLLPNATPKCDPKCDPQMRPPNGTPNGTNAGAI